MKNLKPIFRNILFILTLISSVCEIDAQYNDKNYAIGVYYNYTVSSKFYDNPRDPDLFVREQYKSIDRLKSFSLDARYAINSIISVGLGAGYLKSSAVFSPLPAIGNSGQVVLRAKDSYEFIPVELSLYYNLPFSTDEFKFYMGGGGGLYFGNHIRDVNGTSVTTVEREYDFGIHVIVGLDYLIDDFLAIRGQMHFRDPQFEMKSEYDSPSVVVEGETYLIRQSSIYSKVNVDGIIFSIGLSLFL